VQIITLKFLFTAQNTFAHNITLTNLSRNTMARNPSALIWISHKASEVQKKHKNMKWKTAIKEALAQYRKKHGTKKVDKKIWKKKKVRINITLPNFRSISVYHLVHMECNHDKQCSICYYETSILEFGMRQKMAQSS